MSEPLTTAATASRRGAYAAVFLAILLDLVGFGMVLPLMPFYAEQLRASVGQVGLVFAAYSLAQLLLAPSLGRLSDRFGRRPLMLSSITASVVAYLIFAYAGSLTALLVSRALAGAAAANYGIAQAYVADVTPPAGRSRAMGLVGAAFGLGFVVGPALGGLLGQIGPRVVPLTAAGLSAVNLLLAVFFLRESLPASVREESRGKPLLDASELRDLWRDLPRRRVMWLFFLVMFCFSMMEASLALYGQWRFGYGRTQTSWLFVYTGLLLVAVQGGLLGRLVKRFGDATLILAGIAMMAAGLFLLPSMPLLSALLAGLALLALGQAVHNPSILGLLSRLTHRGAQGETIGVSRSFGALARTLGPPVSTWVFVACGARWPFWSAGALMLVALAIARDLLRRVGARTASPELAGGESGPTAAESPPCPRADAVAQPALHLARVG